MKPVGPISASLRASLLRCAALLVVAAAITTATYRWRTEVATAQTDEMERRDELEARIRSAASDAELAEAGAARYRDLIGRGIVGPERRANWLDHLSRERERGRLLDAEYEIRPQQLLSIDGVSTESTRYKLMSSTMKLRAGLLHEQDFVDFLVDMRQSVSALLHVQACRIERAADVEDKGIRLRAECTLDWVTLREKT